MAMPAAAQIDAQDATTVTDNMSSQSAAIEVLPATPAIQTQDYCISMMSDFPSDDHLPRYQFFRLTEELSRDVTPELRQLLTQYGEKDIQPNTPILEIIEAMANPVLRQAAPEIVVAYMGQLMDFSDSCAPFISGQVNSLQAFDGSLVDGDVVIMEDALYLRQILSDSLSRLDADQDPYLGYAAAQYANDLVRTRDDIEYTAFVDDIDNLEALYMEDLDGRLARSNDIINSEIDREALGDAITLSDDMNDDLRRKSKEERIYTLLRILSRY
jgi:hypothetical protein